MPPTAPATDPSAALLAVQGLCRRFGRRWALAHVTFELRPGQALMITGANGSGKSTLLRCLSTALRPHQGTITVSGRELWRHRRTLRYRIAFLSHASRLYSDLSAADNLRVWGRLAQVPVDPPALLTRVGLDPKRRDPVRTFSAGMGRRLALARTLLTKPDLLLLDEPFSALDPDGRALVADVAAQLRDAGTAVLMATHLPQEAIALCPTGFHMDAGQIVWRGPSAETPALGGGAA